MDTNGPLERKKDAIVMSVLDVCDALDNQCDAGPVWAKLDQDVLEIKALRARCRIVEDKQNGVF